MSRMILFDEARCTNCHLCEMYCSLVFGQRGVYEYRPSIARIRVVENDDDTRYVAHVCLQCEAPACVDACPTGALYKDPATGIVVVDAGECTGCEMCVDACEFDCIFIVGGPSTGSGQRHAVKCEVCDDPLCVRACAVKALTVGEPDAAYRARTEQLYREVRL
ncbi:MAG: 4Fe-4S dicluster domain-containing protein [Chloroflexota bacterium]